MPSIGTSRLPYDAIEKFGDKAFVADGKYLYFGTDGDVSLMYDATTDNQLEVSGDTNWPHPKTNTAVATPGGATGLAIPVTHGIVAKTTGGAEALTLADGEDGQMLLIYMAGDSGVGTLTPSTKTGFTNIAFADVGDTACLYFVNGTLGWIILSVWGLTGPPTVT